MNHHAAKHYHQCLTYAVADRLAATSLSEPMAVDGSANEAEAEEREFDDYAKAAAYNLTTMYMFLGQPDLAKEVADRWLAV